MTKIKITTNHTYTVRCAPVYVGLKCVLVFMKWINLPFRSCSEWMHNAYEINCDRMNNKFWSFFRCICMLRCVLCTAVYDLRLANVYYYLLYYISMYPCIVVSRSTMYDSSMWAVRVVCSLLCEYKLCPFNEYFVNTGMHSSWARNAFHWNADSFV